MGRKRKKIANKPCSACHKTYDTLVRIRTAPEQDWRMVCRTCWPRFAEDNPTYQYGGLWRAHKRRK